MAPIIRNKAQYILCPQSRGRSDGERKSRENLNKKAGGETVWQRHRNVSSTQRAGRKLTANRKDINNDNGNNNLEAGDAHI